MPRVPSLTWGVGEETHFSFPGPPFKSKGSNLFPSLFPLKCCATRNSFDRSVRFSCLKALGEAIGEAIGETLGEAIGEALGEAIGEALGEAIGEALGEAIGEALGEAFGEAIGEALGEAFGEAIGEALGEAIGAVKVSFFPPGRVADASRVSFNAVGLDLGMLAIWPIK